MKFENIFDKTIKLLSLIFFSWIFILLVDFEKSIIYAEKKDFLISNSLIVTIGALLIVLKKKFIKIKIRNLNYDKIVKRMVIVLFFVQLYVFYHTYFETGWDSGYIVSVARNITIGGKIPEDYYYLFYPNNIPYTLIVALILKINSLFGLFGNDYDLMSMVFINCIISSFSSYLIYKIGKQLLNKKIAFIGYLVSVILFVFSPWNIISYSDSFCIFIPILILSIYINKKIKWYYKFPLIALLGYIVLPIKPHCEIIVIAIIIVELFKTLVKFNLTRLKKAYTVMSISVILILITKLILNVIYIANGFDPNPETKFGYQHFLMMGANSYNNGVYYDQDVIFSANQPDNKTRNKENFKVYIKRVEEYGFPGYFEFLSKKLLTVYNDGSFAWMREGYFLIGLKPETTKISKGLREIYYGESYLLYSTILQFVWINTIFLIFFNSVIMMFKKQKIDYTYLVITLTIIGLTIFELLFEVRARYLYTNVPIFIMLMMYSINNIQKIDLNNLSLKLSYKMKRK